jgi:hypothetical protein
MCKRSRVVRIIASSIVGSASRLDPTRPQRGATSAGRAHGANPFYHLADHSRFFDWAIVLFRFLSTC